MSVSEGALLGVSERRLEDVLARDGEGDREDEAELREEQRSLS